MALIPMSTTPSPCSLKLHRQQLMTTQRMTSRNVQVADVTDLQLTLVTRECLAIVGILKLHLLTGNAQVVRPEGLLDIAIILIKLANVANSKLIVAQ